MTEQKQWRVVWLGWTERNRKSGLRSTLSLFSSPLLWLCEKISSSSVHKVQTKQWKGCSKGWWSACFNIRQGINMPENNEFGNRVGCRPSFYCYNQNVFVVLLVDHNRSVRSMQNPRVLDAEVDSEQTQKIIQLIARLFSLRHSIFWFLIATVVPPPPFGYPVLLHKNQLTSCDRLGSSLTVLVPVWWFFFILCFPLLIRILGNPS